MATLSYSFTIILSDKLPTSIPAPPICYTCLSQLPVPLHNHHLKPASSVSYSLLAGPRSCRRRGREVHTSTVSSWRRCSWVCGGMRLVQHHRCATTTFGRFIILILHHTQGSHQYSPPPFCLSPLLGYYSRHIGVSGTHVAAVTSQSRRRSITEHTGLGQWLSATGKSTMSEQQNLGYGLSSNTQQRFAQSQLSHTYHFLTTSAYAASTTTAYNIAVNRYLSYCAHHGQHVSVSQLDQCVEEYICHLYLLYSGRNRQRAVNTVYGLYMLQPSLREQLRGSEALLAGWQRVVPSAQHPPLTWPLTVAIARTMAANDLPQCAVATLVAFDGLLRVGKLVRIAVADVSMPHDSRRGGSSHISSHSASSAAHPSVRRSTSIFNVWQSPRPVPTRRLRSAIRTSSHCWATISLHGRPMDCYSISRHHLPPVLRVSSVLFSVLCVALWISTVSTSRLTLCVTAVPHMPICTWVRQLNTSYIGADGGLTHQPAPICNQAQRRSSQQLSDRARHYVQGLQVHWQDHMWAECFQIYRQSS